MAERVIRFTVFFLFFMFAVSLSSAQEKKPGGLPSTAVVVSELKASTVFPELEFIGTVYYPEWSNVAAESSGRVEEVHFEEGQRVKKGDLLVTINLEILEKTLQAVIASYEEALVNLEKARSDLDRVEPLHRRKFVPEQLYDENRFKVQSLEKKVASLMAETERLKVELDRKAVRAPFDGIVIKGLVDRGEWLQMGSAVATVAKDEIVDIIVDVPEAIAKSARIGMDVKVKTGGKETTGKLLMVIPKGDMATRTFPIKVRIDNSLSLVEGMEATVSLPGVEVRKSLIISRDAAVALPGQTVVFALIDSRVKMIPVKVVGYRGAMAGIEGEGLSEGMKVVIRGNEKLKDGQRVTVVSGGR